MSLFTCCVFCLTLWAIFVHAPIEQRMGIVQKIFYFHVPSATAMYVGFGLSALASIAYLIKRSPHWDALAVASAEVGTLFCAIVLTTGPIWARKAWGVYWTWDPRLTTTLLAGLIFMSYLVLRGFEGAGDAERRFAAGLAIVAIPNLFIIHYSVQLWRGTHPTVITGRGQGLAPDMQPALAGGFVLMLCVVGLLIWLRTRAERSRQRLRELELEAAELGLAEGKAY